MKTSPQILIAKYSSDVLRMEPRNAGVIVWSPEKVVAKFLGEHADNTVRSPRIVPKEDRHAYKEWISYWRLMIARDAIRTDRGKMVPRSSPEFIGALCAKSKARFVLVDAGFMRGKIESHELLAIADECFDILVKEPETDRVRQHKIELRQAAQKAFEMASVEDYGDLRRRFPITCKIGKVTKDLPFDYAIVQQDTPLAVFQRVSIPQDESIFVALYKFEHLSKNARKKQHKTVRKCALVLTDEQDGGSSDNLTMLSESVDEVIDLADTGEAALKIRGIAA